MKTMPKLNSKLSLELGDLCLGLRLGRWGYVVRLHCCWGKELDEEKSRDAYIYSRGTSWMLAGLWLSWTKITFPVEPKFQNNHPLH